VYFLTALSRISLCHLNLFRSSRTCPNGARELDEEEARDEAEISARSSANRFVWQIITDASVLFITELDNQGLYIEKGSTRIPTNELQVTKQPPTSKVPASFPREATT
jgi:hypothetical protein